MDDHRQRLDPRKGRRRGWRTIALGGLASLLVSGALLITGAVIYVQQQSRNTPDIASLRQAAEARASVMLSADGQELGRFARVQRSPVTLEQVSPELLKALIATEDHRFPEHRGVDWRRTVSAALHTAGGDTQGGSTITQQLARNLFPQQIGREQSISRKVREMATALRIERHFSKQQILEAYLNSAPFLYNVVGIEMAARTYFDTTAADLDTLQAATLVGMLKGTAYYNPVRYPERSLARRNVVLAQMVRHGQLSAERQQTLAAMPLQLQFNRPGADDDATAPHFVAHVRRQVLEWADRNDHDLYTEGLVIHTTLDTRLQQAAAEAVERQAAALQAVADVEWSAPTLRAGGNLEAYARQAQRVEPFAHFWAKNPALLQEYAAATPEVRKAVAAGRTVEDAVKSLAADAGWLRRLKARHTRLEAGLVAIDPHSGAVRAWVGSRDFALDQFDHVAQAQRQPGSTFKPFVYGAALESGKPSTDTFMDTAVEWPQPDGSVWRPTDMGGNSETPMTLREGLVKSKNTITAQVSQAVGVQKVAALARAMGVDQSRLDVVPSLALGTSPVTLLEMTSAYATLAAIGERRDPVVVQRIVDRHGSVLAEFGAAPRRVMSLDNAVELIDMLRDAVDRGTGTAVRQRFGIRADVAGKTGTTQDNTDGWFILMHPTLVTGAWVGFNDPRITMRSDWWGQGGHNAVLLVGDFVRGGLKDGWVDASQRFPEPPPPPPPPILPPPPEDDLLAARAPVSDDPVRGGRIGWSTARGSRDAAPGEGAGNGTGTGEGYPWR